MSLVVFQKSLHDLVKGIRGHKKDPALFISQAIAEIKQELKSNDPFVKAQAVRKLTYLQMIGYNVSWASFSIVEAMSQPRFAHKRAAYLAACQSFNDETEVILLTTNLFKKEFMSANQYDVGVAINCVANIVNKDLARDLLSDMVGLMTHSKPYVRKKAVLAMYKVYVKYPQALRLTFERLKDQLEDADSSVVSCAVNVICELANKNPRNYLAMAPKFFRLLTTSSNNWMLIKVVKLLGSLVAEEPRLARKLLEPLATIIQNTAAKSLQYECIHTVTLALPFTKRDDGTEARNVPAVVRLCADNLRSFVEDPDQNLKYLGLVGFVNLMRSHPRTVVEHRQLVIRCLNDDDVTIRTRALELLTGMVTRRSLQDLVNQLMQHVRVAEGVYKDELVSKILFMCSRDKYSFLTDFAWYISVLVELASVQGLHHGQQVAEQLVEVALRVDTIRPFLVECMLPLLLDSELCVGSHREAIHKILQAAAWAVSEYSEILSEIAGDTAPDDVDDEDEEAGAYWIEGPANEEVRSDWRGRNVHVELIDAMLHPRVTNLATQVQATYLQAVFKIFLRVCEDCSAEVVSEVIQIFKNTLGVFLQSMDLEVQERATSLRHLLSEFHILTFEQDDEGEEADDEQKVKDEPKPIPAPEPLLLLEPFVSLMDTAQHKSAHYSLAGLQSQDAPSLAKQQVTVLRSLIAEPCYAVNPKAQRRVPAPDDLDLETPFNPLAVDAIVSITEPELKELATVSFSVLPTVRDSFRDVLAPVQKPSTRYEPVGDDERRMSQMLGEAFEDEEVVGHGEVPTPRQAEKSEKASRRDKDADLFYLRSAQDAGKAAVVFDELMGFEGEDVVPAGSRSARSKKKGTRKSKKRNTAQSVTVAELMPEGAVSSDDEAGLTGNGKHKRRGTRRTGHDDEDLELGDVDVTVPLRDDEIIPVSRHRSPRVAQLTPEDGESAKHRSVDDAGAKKKKKKKKSSTKVSGSRNADAEVDLLGFEPVDSESKHSDVAGDLIGLTMPVTKATTKAKTKPLWLPIGELGSISLVAATQFDDTTRQVLIRLRGRNTGSTAALNVEFIAQTLPTEFLSSQGSRINIVLTDRVDQDAEFEAAISLTSNVAPIAACAGSQLVGVFQYSVASAAAERVIQQLTLVIPSATFMQPAPMSESKFMDMLAAQDWSRATARVSYTGKAKSTFKALAGFLHASPVESEDTKAMSLCATHWAGTTVAILCKRQSESVMSVDVKCRGAGAPQLAQSLATELSQLAL